MTVTASTTVAGAILAWMSITISVSTNTGVATFGLALDGTAEVGVVTALPGSNAMNMVVSVFGIWTGVAPGSHTVTGRWHSSATNVTVTGIGTSRHMLVQSSA
jgi:hypothetical protein